MNRPVGTPGVITTPHETGDWHGLALVDEHHRLLLWAGSKTPRLYAEHEGHKAQPVLRAHPTWRIVPFHVPAPAGARIAREEPDYPVFGIDEATIAGAFRERARRTSGAKSNLADSAQRRVFRFLEQHPAERFTSRHIGDALGLGISTASHACNQLAAVNTIGRVKAPGKGPAYLFFFLGP